MIGVGRGDMATRDPGSPAPTGSPGSLPEPPDGTEPFGDPSRVVAFSDGVFAIVITILVLEVAVPAHLGQRSLHQALDELRPTLVAWVVSFLLTGMYWVAHRDLFARIRVVNRDLVWLNLLFLLPTGLIPFAASVLGEYPSQPIALRIYGTVMIAVAVMRLVLYWYVRRRPWLLRHHLATSRSRTAIAVAAVPIPVYLVAMIVADASQSASLALFFVVPGLYFLVVTVLRERPGTRDEVSEFS